MRISPRTVLVPVLLVIGALIVSSFAHALDLEVYRAAGRSLAAGRTDLYSADFAISSSLDYHYPPIFLLLFWPLAMISKQAAVFTWSFLTLALVYSAVKQLGSVFTRFFKDAGIKYGHVVAIASLICLKYFLLNLKYLNVHLIVLALVLISFCLVVKKSSVLASLLMAGAIALKVFPIFLLPYYLLKREFKFVALTLAFLFAFVAVPAFYFGVERNIDLHQSWFRHAFIDTAYHEVNGPIDVSVVGVTRRYLSHVNYQDRVDDPNYENVNLMDIDHARASLIGKSVAAVIFFSTYAFILFSIRRQRKGARSGTEDPDNFNYVSLMEFGLVICMMLLAIPRTPVGYHVAIFIPLVPLITAIWITSSRVLYVATSIVVLVTCVLPLIPTAKFQRLSQVIGVEFIAVSVLWLAMILLIERFDLKKALETNIAESEVSSL